MDGLTHTPERQSAYSRGQQGFPRQIADPVVLYRVAQLLMGRHLDRADSGQGTGRDKRDLSSGTFTPSK